MFQFLELDEVTRSYMLRRFEEEQASLDPYRSKGMSAAGLSAFSQHMREAIQNGNEVTLTDALMQPHYWRATDGRGRTDLMDSANRLAVTEFNTWYVRGLATRLLDEGVETCTVYRADLAYQPRGICSSWEGRPIAVADVLAGHRAQYHGPAADRTAFSVPNGPYCHHSICRLEDYEQLRNDSWASVLDPRV